MNMQMRELMKSLPHILPCILYINFELFFLLLKHVKVCPNMKIYQKNIILHLFRVDIRQVLLSRS